MADQETSQQTVLPPLSAWGRLECRMWDCTSLATEFHEQTLLEVRKDHLARPEPIWMKWTRMRYNMSNPNQLLVSREMFQL